MSATTPSPGTLTVRLERLFVPENVREIDEDFISQLERSVKARGRIINPVEVIDADPDTHGKDYDYALVAGFRRTEVARRLGHEEIPGFYGDTQHEHTDRAVENMVRKQLNPYEEAIAIQRTLDEGKSENQTAELLGISKNLVTRRIKLLALPDTAQRLIGDGTLSLGTVEPMSTIAKTNPVLLEVLVEYIAEHAEELHPDDLTYQPLAMTMQAVASSESDVFAVPLRGVPVGDTVVMPQDEPTMALVTEASDLYKQLHPHNDGHPRIRFTEAEIDRARAAGVLIEYGEEDPLVVDLEVYQDLCRTAIAASVERMKQQLSERAELEVFKNQKKTGKDTPDEKYSTLQTTYRREIRQLAATAHGANLDLGTKLRAGLNVVDPEDINVARFFVYALLGPDSASYYARDTVVSAVALRGIRLVIGDFREDLTKTRKDGSAGALRITYGQGIQHENQSTWLWKYLDGARTAGELYGRALVVIAAEQYASRLVIPSTQQTKPLGWPSHEDIALKALTKLAGPHIAPTLKTLEKAVATAEREHKEAMLALLEDQRRVKDAEADEATGDEKPRGATGNEEPDEATGDAQPDVDSDLPLEADACDLGRDVQMFVLPIGAGAPATSDSIPSATLTDPTVSEPADPTDESDRAETASGEDVVDASADIDF